MRLSVVEHVEVEVEVEVRIEIVGGGQVEVAQLEPPERIRRYG